MVKAEPLSKGSMDFYTNPETVKKTGFIRDKSEKEIVKKKQHVFKKGRYLVGKKQSKLQHWLTVPVPTRIEHKMQIDSSDKENNEFPVSLNHMNSPYGEPNEPFLPLSVSQDMPFAYKPVNDDENGLEKANMKITSLKLIIEEKDEQIRELKSVLRKITKEIPEEYHPTSNEFSLYF